MTNEALREEFCKEFPPPMLLGQNQERVCDWWLAKLTAHDEELKMKIVGLFKKQIDHVGWVVRYDDVLALLTPKK